MLAYPSLLGRGIAWYRRENNVFFPPVLLPVQLEPAGVDVSDLLYTWDVLGFTHPSTLGESQSL